MPSPRPSSRSTDESYMSHHGPQHLTNQRQLWGRGIPASIPGHLTIGQSGRSNFGGHLARALRNRRNGHRSLTHKSQIAVVACWRNQTGPRRRFHSAVGLMRMAAVAESTLWSIRGEFRKIEFQSHFICLPECQGSDPRRVNQVRILVSPVEC